MILNRTDALYAANVFIDYFAEFGRIDDYLRRVKLERMSNYPTSLPGMGPQDDMFDDLFSQHSFRGMLQVVQQPRSAYAAVRRAHAEASLVLPPASRSAVPRQPRGIRQLD